MEASDLTRRRGPNKAAPWVRRATDGLSVIRLPLDTSDPVQRRLVESIFQASFSLRRALQSDGRSRLDAFWAASRERARDGWGPVLQRLGLSEKALAYAAYEHLDAAPHLRRFVTKALAMHMADSRGFVLCGTGADITDGGDGSDECRTGPESNPG